jgi:hypothetical protein
MKIKKTTYKIKEGKEFSQWRWGHHLTLSIGEGGFLRFKQTGVYWKKIAKMSFSEREGHIKTIKIGEWCIGKLKPLNDRLNKM